MKRRSLLLIFFTTCVLGVGATPAGADDVPLIADIDIEALLEQELETLNVGDFYLLEHLVDIDTKVKDRQTRMGAVRDEADRIFARFVTIENQIALDREQSETVLGKAFERVVRTYTIPDEAQQEAVHQDDFERPDPEPGKDVLLGAATRGDLTNVDTIVPAATPQPSAVATPQPSGVATTVPPLFEGPSVLVMLLEELERSQSAQAELRETLRDELEALGTQLEDMEESETELDGAIRGLRAELVAIEAREIEWDPEEITPETIILPSTAAITSGWGRRWHPILRIMRNHYGTDFDAARGAPVWAAHQGVVETATYMTDFGRVIVLNHGNGFSTLYGHLNKIRVKYGETVRQGQRIGDVGSSGLSTGPHLHFEMRINHVLRNPKKYLPY
ncbi:MAG: peptidoglycan DD-metalloendopeptidase family protein [Actinomycetota bacterium]|nr:peptidoglycan DD-metalloendopeptidase family protein [Actinomycetota bacterium]